MWSGASLNAARPLLPTALSGGLPVIVSSAGAAAKSGGPSAFIKGIRSERSIKNRERARRGARARVCGVI